MVPHPGDAPPDLHPLVHAGRWIAIDLSSTLVFVALFALTHSVLAATGLAIAGGVAHIAWLKFRRATVDAMQWLSLGLVAVFGGASLLTHDPRFMMLKPTLIYAAIGAVMLRRGWINRYNPPMALGWSADVHGRLRLCLGWPDVRDRGRQPLARRAGRPEGVGLVPGRLSARLEARPVRRAVRRYPLHRRHPHARCRRPPGRAGVLRSARG